MDILVTSGELYGLIYAFFSQQLNKVFLSKCYNGLESVKYINKPDLKLCKQVTFTQTI